MRKDEKFRSRLRIGGFSALLVVVIGLLAFGWSTHTEAGLQGVCWDGDQVARIETDGAKDCPELIWPQDQIPLSVYAFTTNPNPAGDPAKVSEGVRELVNYQVGFTLFVASPSYDEADVIIQTGVAYDSSWEEARGRTFYDRANGRMRARIQTTNEGTEQLMHERLVHEYGHAAGLAHDDFSDSAMFVASTSTRFTDDDRKTLREAYWHSLQGRAPVHQLLRAYADASDYHSVVRLE